MSGTSAACACGPYSHSEYMAPLERQLAAEAALATIPSAVLAVIAEYMVPRFLIVMDESRCVVTRAPCALFSGATPHLATAAQPATTAQPVTAAQLAVTATPAAPEMFPLLHQLEMPLQRGPQHRRLEYLEGAAALSHTRPMAPQPQDARKRVWLCVSERAPPVIGHMRHKSWVLTTTSAEVLDDCAEQRLAKLHTSATSRAAALFAAAPISAAVHLYDGEGGGGVGDKEAPLHPCGLQWRAGPAVVTPQTKATAIHFGDSLVAATAMPTSDATVLFHSVALRGSTAVPNPGAAFGAVAAVPLGTSDAVGAKDVDAAGPSLGAEWSSCDSYHLCQVDLPIPSTTRALAWSGRLYLYSFSDRVEGLASLREASPPQKPQLKLYVKNSAPAEHGFTSAWTPHRTKSVSHVPDLFVVAPADKSGEARVLALGGEAPTNVPAVYGHRYPRGRRDAIAVANDPFSEWTLCDWRLPFSARCAAAAFADDWLYVVGVNSATWATRWTPHHELWTGPEWIRLRAGYTNELHAALVVL